MQHIDWFGMGYFITSIVAAVSAIAGWIQALRNHQKIQQVEQKVNGVTSSLVEEAHKSGRLEEQTRQLEAGQSGILRPPPGQ